MLPEAVGTVTGPGGREERGVWVYYRARTDALASLATLIGRPPA
jgi:hypothetical protein